MIAKQTKGKDIPGRGTHVDKGLEVGTRCYTGIRGGWSVELGEMCQAGRLGQDVKASCISPRRLDSIVKTGEPGARAVLSALALPTFGAGSLWWGCPAHSRMFSSISELP